MTHHAGFVNIIGRPNAGKSTLMNLLIGEKISIITPKAQTTRHRILGMINRDDCQVVFSDTPGILETSSGLHKSMMSSVMTAIHDADILLYLVDLSHEKHTAENTIIEIIKNIEIPVLLILNKCDLLTSEAIAIKIEEWKKILPKAEIFVVSALKAIETEKLLERIISLLPESPAYYDKDALTDRNMRFITSEIVREKVFMNYHQEVPYSTHVEIVSFKEDSKIVRISAVIHVSRESQKGILIGEKGKAIKKVGIESRKDIEKWLGRQVFLELSVKVSKDWRDNESRLKSFGYDS